MRLRFDGLEVLVDEGVVRTAWAEVSLRPTEFRLLVKLASESHRAHTREELLRSLWHSFPGARSRTVDMHVARLRRALGPAGVAIRTVRGIGYRFDPDRIASPARS